MTRGNLILFVKVNQHCDVNLNLVLDSDSGTFLGLGTVTGSVAIYIAFSLQVKAIWTHLKLTGT